MRKITLSLINNYSYNGLYFFLKFLNLEYSETGKYKSVQSPFRRDRRPSFGVVLDKSKNVWFFKDFKTGESGDVYKFAALIYGKDLKEDFHDILKLMAKDLELDLLDDIEYERIMNLDIITQGESIIRTKESLENYLGKKIKTHLVPHEELQNPIFTKINFANSFTELNVKEKEFLTYTGIDFDVMIKYGAFFISSYCVGEKEFVRPFNVVWIAYKFYNFYKIYCPNPKAFWSFGIKNSSYQFGDYNFQSEQESIVILAAGEKDCLVLLSKGYRAMCLQSESSKLTKRQINSWYFENHFRLIVLYDLDETGIDQAKRLNQELGLQIAFLPNWVIEKGGKDVSDFFRLGGTVEELNQELGFGAKPFFVHHNTSSVRTAKQRLDDAKNLPEIQPFFDVFIQLNELVILFGDTGKGKSILAVALADAISKGQELMGLENKNNAIPVVYYDFELGDKQFQKRYTDDLGIPYEFSNEFYIDNIATETILQINEPKQKFEKALIKHIKKDIEATGGKFLVIDNITYLSTETPEDSQVALNVMRELKELKNRKDLTILVLAHTPKKFGAAGITLADLAGSKHLSNFADSVFAIAASSIDSSIRYLKQVKPSRSAEVKFDNENVLVCEIAKDENFLSFKFLEFTPEWEHTKSPEQSNQEDHIEQSIQLQKQGKTIREIATLIGVSKSQVGRWLKPLEN